jgi:hypothetical protein
MHGGGTNSFILLPHLKNSITLSAMPERKDATYIRRTLVSNEQVLYVGKLHNFAYVPPVLLLLIGLFLIFLPNLMGEGAVQQHASKASGLLERATDTVVTKIAQAKEYIPEEALPYLEKANTMRRVGLGMLLLVFGLIKLVNTVIKKKTVEHAVTNKKTIKKKGMIAVETNELNLDRIESVKIHQTAFDRIINRGRVLVTGIGMEQIDMRGMKNPAELKKAILETIDLFVKK